MNFIPDLIPKGEILKRAMEINDQSFDTSRSPDTQRITIDTQKNEIKMKVNKVKKEDIRPRLMLDVPSEENFGLGDEIRINEDLKTVGYENFNKTESRLPGGLVNASRFGSKKQSMPKSRVH